MKRITSEIVRKDVLAGLDMGFNCIPISIEGKGQYSIDEDAAALLKSKNILFSEDETFGPTGWALNFYKA